MEYDGPHDELTREATLEEKVDFLATKVDALVDLLTPLAPFIATLPEMAAKVEPLMAGLSKSPVLRMLGVNLDR